MKHLCLVMLGIGLVVFSADGYAQNAKHGADAYKLCASCHGFKGEGNRLVNAPSLAGQEDWYLDRQIKNFRDRIRGSSNDDVHGRTMANMAMAIGEDDDVADIVAYIRTLPVAVVEASIAGDVDSGRAHYAPCAACHGAAGEGNPALNAPALVTMQDWYQLAQLQKFKSGHRGANPADVYGMQMAPMAAVLADEQAMRDVVAYIISLQ